MVGDLISCFEQALIINNKIKIKNLSPKSLIKKFFFKYDKKAHIRFKNILKKI